MFEINQRWTLHIEKFARIDSADIEISPLMCFIGDNNSGKSYVMSLLWGLMSNYKFFYDTQLNQTQKYNRCKEWILSNVDKDICINEEVEQFYVDWLNEILAYKKDKFIQKIFNNDSVKIGKMEITNFHCQRKLNLSVKKSVYDSQLTVGQSKTLTTEGIEQITVEFPLDSPIQEKILWHINFYICWNLIMGDWLTIPDISMVEPIYLPASRTGFLLARREIANKSIENTFSLPNDENSFQERFTAPYIKFLQILNSLTDSQKTNNLKKLELIKFLQKEILHGELKVKEDGKVIRYIPEENADCELSMNITSSVVTETSALLLLLTTRMLVRLIIIEEPEAHLHPALQKKMAQLLIKFVHNGFPIWITTHSDTILQHFNNMIKLNNRSYEDRHQLLQDFNYTDEDLLSPDEINLYQFERGEIHTEITKLQSGKYGFVANLFNKAIEELVNEIYAFQEDD